ncbi:trypsin-like serine protease [Gordonia malaquae]|uniref:trypsin-like serine protease n=1 Tax=Gordonia malaquae TaxID=410332 RepID=UPI00301994DD
MTSRSGAVQMCTIGAIVDDRHALTAAHCGQITDQVRMSGEPGAPAIGAISVRQTRQDLATITIYESVPIDRPSRIASTDSLPAGLAVAGHGSTSGRRTGYIPTGRVINRESDDRASISELVESTICANGGDSGGPVYQAGTDLIVGTIIAQRRPVRGECRSLLSPSSRWADPF